MFNLSMNIHMLSYTQYFLLLSTTYTENKIFIYMITFLNYHMTVEKCKEEGKQLIYSHL